MNWEEIHKSIDALLLLSVVMWVISGVMRLATSCGDVSHNVRHPLDGSESHAHGLKAEVVKPDTSRLNVNIRTAEPTEE